MRRSQINTAIDRAIQVFDTLGCKLPPWATWSPQKWKEMGPEADQIRTHGLGWQISDFGKGDFERCGILLFVASSGLYVPGGPPIGEPYAEKLFLVLPGQTVPDHWHKEKDETLLVRGGGELEVELAWPTADERALQAGELTVQIDALTRKVPASGIITLEPGQRVHFPRMLSHLFRGKQGRGDVWAGELSNPNDDRTDNYFLVGDVTRTPIDEDDPPQFLLLNEYPAPQG
jgi:D-lyxose ketol-isomerase